MRLWRMRFWSMKGQDSIAEVENEIHFQEPWGRVRGNDEPTASLASCRSRDLLAAKVQGRSHQAPVSLAPKNLLLQAASSGKKRWIVLHLRLCCRRSGLL